MKEYIKMRNQWSPEKTKEIQEMAYIMKMLSEGKNRLQIWKEMRESGFSGDMALEVLRELGLFNG